MRIKWNLIEAESCEEQRLLGVVGVESLGGVVWSKLYCQQHPVAPVIVGDKRREHSFSQTLSAWTEQLQRQSLTDPLNN